MDIETSRSYLTFLFCSFEVVLFENRWYPLKDLHYRNLKKHQPDVNKGSPCK